MAPVRTCYDDAACANRPLPCPECTTCLRWTQAQSRPPVCIVKPLGFDRYTLTPAEDHDIVVITNADGSADALVLRKDREETTRLRIQAPSAGRKIAIVRLADRSIEVIYHDGVEK